MPRFRCEVATNSPRLDLAEVARLEFFPPDSVRFPSIDLARAVLRAGGGAPAILSAANEVAVEAFLCNRIGFLDIVRLVADVLDCLGAPSADSLELVIAHDAAARVAAEAWVLARA